MTKRSLIIGVLGAIVFAVTGRYVNFYVPGPQIVRGHLPVSVFGLLILCAVAINPLLARIRSSWRLSGQELALILALWLAVSTIIDAGLMRHFPKVCMIGMQAERTTPSMRTSHVLQYVPPFMLANDGKYSEQVVDEYIAPGDPIAWPHPWYAPWKWNMGQFSGTLSESWARIPWAQWWRPLLYWGAAIALSYVAVMGLSVLVHRQWARREKIRYPLAEIISSLLGRDAGGNAILSNKGFWLGFGLALFISAGNLIRLWYPDSIYIPTSFSFPVIIEAFPKLMETAGASYFANFKIFPAAVGIAFLLASDIGFGLGISNVVAVFTLYFLLHMGVDTSSGGALEGGVIPFQSFGAYLAYALMIMYIGRRHYWQTAKGAFGLVSGPEDDKVATWGMRVFLLSTCLVFVMLILGGITWHIAAIGVLLVMMMFLVLARMNAEAGTFFCQPSWTMPMILLCFYGFGALGPRNYLGMAMVGYVLVAGAFECLMPYVVNGLKVTTDTGLRVGRVAMLTGATVIAAMALTVVSGLWSDYQNSVSMATSKDRLGMYQTAERQLMRLQLAGELEASQAYDGLQRLVHIQPDREFLVWTAVGFILVMLLSAARLRWAWWPLHPIILLTFGSILMVGRYGASLLLGWFIKVFITKVAGPTQYTATKPFIIGIIAGDILGGLITMMALWGYYLFTGAKGPGWQFW